MHCVNAPRDATCKARLATWGNGFSRGFALLRFERGHGAGSKVGLVAAGEKLDGVVPVLQAHDLLGRCLVRPCSVGLYLVWRCLVGPCLVGLYSLWLHSVERCLLGL